MSEPMSATPAPLRLRLAAAAYDLLPLLGLWFAAAVLALAITGGALDTHTLAGKFLVQGLALVLSGAYFIVSWSRGGQTIGMRAWKLRMVRADGRRVRWPLALLRFVVALLSLAALGAGFWWALVDAQKRTWHDMAADTVWVRIE
ncbi:MAG: RDD family protein [Xanthomonadaceae bacterium]|nr:RDD family protein [Xanthomonadaceae bacterium]MDE2257450.1 RDD family protein [Xanthomonadaceae bacterium]